jgi:hypothetical protein
MSTATFWRRRRMLTLVEVVEMILFILFFNFLVMFELGLDI